jgi:hypothetical protein
LEPKGIRSSGGIAMHELIGKIVIVEAHEITYTGKLIEIGEEEVHLESESGWIVIPVDSVSSIQAKEG